MLSRILSKKDELHSRKNKTETHSFYSKMATRTGNLFLARVNSAFFDEDKKLNCMAGVVNYKSGVTLLRKWAQNRYFKERLGELELTIHRNWFAQKISSKYTCSVFSCFLHSNASTLKYVHRPFRWFFPFSQNKCSGSSFNEVGTFCKQMWTNLRVEVTKGVPKSQNFKKTTFDLKSILLP